MHQHQTLSSPLCHHSMNLVLLLRMAVSQNLVGKWSNSQQIHNWPLPLLPHTKWDAWQKYSPLLPCLARRQTSSSDPKSKKSTPIQLVLAYLPRKEVTTCPC